jgi:hypothetical protein
VRSHARESLRLAAHLHRRLLPITTRALGLLLLATLAGCETASDAKGGAGDAEPCLACGDAGDAWDDVDGSLGLRAQRRLAACRGIEGCHVSNAGGLSFPPGAEAAELVGVPSTERPDMLRVKPGDPRASYLYLKVLGDGGIEGGTMPLGSTAVDPRVPALFFAWIEAGAPAP